MNFHSVHNSQRAFSFREALFAGLAPDGGLFVPEFIPRLKADTLQRNTSFHEIGAEILSKFIDEIPEIDLHAILRRAWNFPVPLVRLDDGIFLLELFHGPTLAFKDIGARFMSHAMSYFLARENRTLTIIVATSGDTGSAVAQSFFDIPQIDVFIFYPSGKISALQERQMTTLGGNITAVEVDGTFDDCQHLVKAALIDPELQLRRTITTANSINLGRLLPQIVYYRWASEQLHALYGIPEQPLMVVPSGNFGNITAGAYAKAIGVPLRGFIAATNANDGVIHYLHTGEFIAGRAIHTMSNAMDVGNPSNLARLRSLYNNDVRVLKNDIDAVSISDDETRAEILKTFASHKYILDPHSAVGVAAARKAQQWMTNAPPIIVTATAHPAKFADMIRPLIGVDIPAPSALRDSLTKPKHTIKMQGRISEMRKVLS